MRINNTNSRWGLFLAFICFLTNLTQLPYFVERGMTQRLAQILWVLVIALCIINRKLKIYRKLLWMLILSAVFAGLIVALSLVTQQNYIGTRIFYSFYLSLAIFLIGIFLNDSIKLKEFVVIYNSYIFSSYILAVDIWMRFLRGSDLTTTVYAYGSKNSASLILFTGLVLMIFEWNLQGRVWSAIRWLMCISMIYILICLRSRAVFVCMFLLFTFILIQQRATLKRFKRVLVISVLVTLYLVFTNKNISDVVINGILFAGRDTGNLNDLTSSRLSEWISFPKLFSQYFWIGAGRYKIESFPLSVLVQYGFLGGIFLICCALWPVVFSVRQIRYSEKWITLLLISASYFVNGLFEEVAPFGPGVKCYFLWLLFGLMYKKWYGTAWEN